METIWNFIVDLFTTPITLYVINTLLILTVIFNERKSASAILAWIMVMTFIPVLGFLLYLVLNQNISRRKINRMTENEEQIFNQAITRQMEQMDRGEYEFSCASTEKWTHLIKLNHVYASSYYTQDNKIELITDGSRLMEMLTADIRRAQKSVNVEFFIIKRDKVGRAFIDVLTEKARQGVEVRLLMDALGSRYMTKGVLKDYLAAGGKVGYYFKPKLIFIGLKLNYRNHRKITVIDDEIAYTGGYNIAKEYVGKKKKFGYWRDTHIKVRGSSVHALNARFVMDWRFATKEKLVVKPETDSTALAPGTSGVQIVSCGPEDPKEEVKRGFMRMITFAEKNVYVQTPYFVPDQSIIESLKMAAQSGADVRIMIPCMPDHPFVYWATYAYIGELLRSGARAWIYDNGFLHAKTLVVDGEVGSVGSTNFDNRSFRLNFETNAFIYDSDFARQMEETFENDMKLSHELTLEAYNRRSLIIRLKEVISRLLTDIL